MTFPKILEEQFEKATCLLRSSRNTVAFTGAGISVPSGIPDFRSAGTGLWNRFDPMEVASFTAFRKRPEAFFNWLEPLAEKALNAIPNAAHRALVEMEASGHLKTVITQNIDGLHQKAGSSDVIELHGNLETLVCLACERQFTLEEFLHAWLTDHIFPRCPYCANLLKPDIVLYEEILKANVFESAEVACEQADVILVAGTSLEVMPASSLPHSGYTRGASLIIVNLSPTLMDPLAEAVIPLDVAIGLPELAKRVMP